MNEKMSMANNVVKENVLKHVQGTVLYDLSKVLTKSFGPMGSNTCIKKENAVNIYTKDGHTILKNIYYHGIIEQSIKDDVESITRHIVTTVGDGTTSAVILSHLIFSALNKIDRTKYTPVEILDTFQKCVDKISEKIRSLGHDCTVEDIYDIAMISTNGNEFISNSLKEIYREHGMEVFIDVSASTDETTFVKTYDGMTLNTGFDNPCYVTDAKKNEAVIDNPHIYFFEHPIDTKEMAVLLDAILSKNIVVPYTEMQKKIRDASVEMVPTVIIAPKISQDLSSLLSSVTGAMAQLPPANKLPLLIITEYHQPEIMKDIALMCNAPMIHKYIDPDIMKQDIENGTCPTPDTVSDFYGFADQVVSNSAKTSFIRPVGMFNEDGSLSTSYNNLIGFLETELETAKANGEAPNVTGKLKRRIHALKSDLVEFIIGGISQSDRDALRDLVEDAVLNCRSAALNGVGYGANFMGMQASIYASANTEGLEAEIMNYIMDAYADLSTELYATMVRNPAEITSQSSSFGCPYNLRTKEFDGKVKSSIESDIIILDSVAKIIGLMATCNQFIVPTPMHNVYIENK
jgi:chaperonin GroEL (HSP60 family)